MNIHNKKQMKNIAEMIQRVYGIQVPEIKMVTLAGKMEKIMRNHHIESLEKLFEIVSRHDDSALYQDFLDIITTHKTDFFRENQHFEFIKAHLAEILNSQSVNNNLEIRVWSAACSTGEEPYSLYMLLKENLPPHIKIQMLATDISQGALKVAMRGVYSNEAVKAIDRPYQVKYFNQYDNQHMIISEEVKNQIAFRQFNLLDPFPFKKKFDLIFCRNVMIYFNHETTMAIVEKMYDVLDNQGHFFIGLSEGLQSMRNQFKFVQPSVYIKDVGKLR